MCSMFILLPNHNNFKYKDKFENLAFVIMPIRENVRLISKTPLHSVLDIFVLYQ